MTSPLAESVINKMWAEGLSPTVADIVRLNALGLEVEKGKRITDLAQFPRRAFLGDLVLTEPTVAEQIWLDAALALVNEEDFTHLAAMVMIKDTADFVKCDTKKEIYDLLSDFEVSVLSPFTESQIMAAVTYALFGFDSEDAESFDKPPINGELPYRVAPAERRSAAREKFLSVVGTGYPKDVALELTVPQLDTLILIRSLKDGDYSFKDEKAQSVARFYYTADNIRKRIIKEKKNG